MTTHDDHDHHADGTDPSTSASDRLIDKLRAFTATLDAEERQLLAALLAPGVDAAWGESEVSGFGLDWSPSLLPSHLADTIRGRNLRVEGW